MSVCRFFLEGRCKFGDKCRNEHPRGGQNQGVQRQLFGGGGGGGNRVTFRDSFGSSQNTSQYKWTAQDNKQQTGSTASADVINALQSEIDVWLQSKQWPFSCISPDKDLPCLPDFEDISPEELRFEAYAAIKAGNIQPYVEKVRLLSVDYNTKKNHLKNANPSLKQKLMQFIEENRNKKSPGVQPSSFGGNSAFGGGGGGFGSGSGGVFGPSSGKSGSSFGQSASSSSIFGGGSSSGSGNVFGKSTGGGIFGQSSAGSSSVFGSAPFGSSSSSSTSVFGGGTGSGTTSTGAFGGSGSTTGFTGSTQTAQTGGFGGSSGTGFGSAGAFGTGRTGGGFGSSGTTGAFGSSGAPFSSSTAGHGFGASTSSGAFGGGAAPTSGGFGGATSGGIFGGSGFSAQQTGTSSFGGASAGASAFGSTQPASGTFGAPTTQSNAPPSGFFSSSGQTTPSASVSAPTPTNSKIYTPLADLTEEEKAQFSAPSFVLGKIPTRPPPQELVNGTVGR